MDESMKGQRLIIKGKRRRTMDEGRWTTEDEGQKIRSSEAEKVRRWETDRRRTRDEKERGKVKG
jgi:hypothetical protein